MDKLVERFMARLRDGEGNTLPEGIKILDIANTSYHTSLGSNEYTFNVWFKKHTGIANRKTFSYKVGSIERCIEIKKAMDKIYNMEEDDLFCDEENASSLVANDNNQEGDFFADSK